MSANLSDYNFNQNWCKQNKPKRDGEKKKTMIQWIKETQRQQRQEGKGEGGGQRKRRGGWGGGGGRERETETETDSKRETDRRTDGRTDRQTDRRQTDRDRHRQTARQWAPYPYFPLHPFHHMYCVTYGACVWHFHSGLSSTLLLFRNCCKQLLEHSKKKTDSLSSKRSTNNGLHGCLCASVVGLSPCKHSLHILLGNPAAFCIKLKHRKHWISYNFSADKTKTTPLSPPLWW